MATIEERVSRLESGYDHLATKADLADLWGELRGMKWTLGVAIAAVAGGLAVLQVVLKFVA